MIKLTAGLALTMSLAVPMAAMAQAKPFTKPTATASPAPPPVSMTGHPQLDEKEREALENIKDEISNYIVGMNSIQDEITLSGDKKNLLPRINPIYDRALAIQEKAVKSGKMKDLKDALEQIKKLHREVMKAAHDGRP